MNAPLPLTRAEVALKVLLIVSGAVTGVAIFPVFMPLDWMRHIHDTLALGPMPAGPIFEYLARSISALYAIHGGLCFVLATDVRRYRPVIIYVATVAVAFAGVILWIDYKVGLPRLWAATEAPTVLVLGGLLLVLAIRARR